jgi:hypothetical protein
MVSSRVGGSTSSWLSSAEAMRMPWGAKALTISQTFEEIIVAHLDTLHGHLDTLHGHLDTLHGHLDTLHGHLDTLHGHLDILHSPPSRHMPASRVQMPFCAGRAARA